MSTERMGRKAPAAVVTGLVTAAMLAGACGQAAAVPRGLAVNAAGDLLVAAGRIRMVTG